MIQVYAVLERAPRGKRARGAAGELLRFVKVGPLVVAAGTLDEAPGLSRDELAKRDRVVRELADRTDAILPARWGSLVADEEALATGIALQERALVQALERVRGCEQMTLRWQDVLPRAVSPRAAAPRTTAPRRARSGKKYLEERARAHAAAHAAPELDPLRPALLGLVRAERVERHEGTGLVTVHHLIERGRAAEYAALVAAAALPFAPRASGPAPPYAFAPEIA